MDPRLESTHIAMTRRRWTGLWGHAAVLITAALPAAAQTPPCLRLSEQLLEQLGQASPSSIESIDALAGQQRATLITRGCSPQATGYDLAVEELKLNTTLRTRPDQGPAIRLDEVLRIEF
jgi:hypothetical protein